MGYDMDESLKRPHFFRSWIIQEIATAKTAIVTDGTSWHVWPIYDKLAHTGTFLPWIQHFDSPKYKMPENLTQLIIDSWSSQASDPRDNVFALLGVISGAGADGLLADYSLFVEHVYTGIATFALLKCTANVLKYASGYGPRLVFTISRLEPHVSRQIFPFKSHSRILAWLRKSPPIGRHRCPGRGSQAR